MPRLCLGGCSDWNRRCFFFLLPVVPVSSPVFFFSVCSRVGPFLQYTEALMLPKWANVNLSTVFTDKSSLCLETEVRTTEKMILSLYGCPHTLLFACLCRCVSSCYLIIKTPPVDIQLHFNLGLNMCVEIYWTEQRRQIIQFTSVIWLLKSLK